MNEFVMNSDGRGGERKGLGKQEAGAWRGGRPAYTQGLSMNPSAGGISAVGEQEGNRRPRPGSCSRPGGQGAAEPSLM